MSFTYKAVNEVVGDVIPPYINVDFQKNIYMADISTFDAPIYAAFDDVDGDITGNVTITYSSDDSGSAVTDLASAKVWLADATGNTVKVTYSVQDAAGNNANNVVALFISAPNPAGNAPIINIDSVDYDAASLSFTPKGEGYDYYLVTSIDGMIGYDRSVNSGTISLDHLPSNTFIVLTVIETNLTDYSEQYSVVYFQTNKVPNIWGEYHSSGNPEENFIASGDKIVHWVDKSGNGHPLIQMNPLLSPNIPTNFGVGGPGTGVEFGNGGDTYLTSDSFTGNMNSSIWMISLKNDFTLGAATTRALFYTHDTYGYYYGAVVDTSSGLLTMGLSNLASTTHTDLKSGRENVLYYTYESTNSQIGVNGNKLGTSFNSGGGGLNNGSYISFGGSVVSAGSGFKGRVYNIMIIANHNGAETDRIISALEKEMKLKTYNGY